MKQGLCRDRWIQRNLNKVEWCCSLRFLLYLPEILSQETDYGFCWLLRSPLLLFRIKSGENPIRLSQNRQKKDINCVSKNRQVLIYKTYVSALLQSFMRGIGGEGCPRAQNYGLGGRDLLYLYDSPQILTGLIEIIIISQFMNFLCNLISPKTYHAQFYASSIKNKRNLPDPSTESEWQISNSEGSSQHIPGNRVAIVNTGRPISTQRIDTASTLPRLRSPVINPEAPNPLFKIIETKVIQRGMLRELLQLRDKEISNEKEAKNNVVVRMIGKSDYENIVKADYKGKKWQDKDFPPTKFYKGVKEQFQLDWPSLEDLSKILNANPHFVVNSFGTTDILQGKVVGDCYFLSALAALARRPERMQRLFHFSQAQELNKNGVYMARLMFKGILQEIVVDDRFPLKTGKNQLLGCKPCLSADNKDYQIYVMVLEKCWAKLWKSYEAIDSGFPHQALHALTGALTKNYLLYDETMTQETKASFFEQVLTFCQHQYVMCSGTGNNEWRNVTIEGNIKIEIAPQHIYCIERFFVDKGQKMVRVYNPWGFNQKTSPKERSQGGFNLSWEQFTSNFKYLTVCKIRDSANYLYTELEDCKINEFTIIDLNISQVSKDKQAYFAITLSETDKKENASNKNPYLTVTYVVLKCITNPQTKLETYELKTTRTEYKFSDHYLQLNDMTVGKYKIAIYFSEVKVNENLTFGVYSQSKFGFEENNKNRNGFRAQLEKAFIDYSKKMVAAQEKVYPLGKDKDIWYSFNVMVEKSNFGYLMLHVGKNEKAFQINMGNKALQEKGLAIWEPYNVDKISIVAEPGHDTIALITINDLEGYKTNDSLFFNKFNKHIHQSISRGEKYY